MTKEIEKFLADGGKIKKLSDEIIVDITIRKHQTRFHFGSGTSILKSKSKPISKTLTDKELSVLPKEIQGIIKARKYRTIKRRMMLKEITKQKNLERLTTI